MTIKSLIPLAAAALLLSACHDNTYRLKGTAQQAADGTIVYLSSDFAEGTPADSAIVQDGQFSFQGQTDSTYLAVVYQAGQPRNSVTFFIEPGESVSITLSTGQSEASSKVEGSTVNNEWQAMNDQMQALNRQSLQLLDSIDDPTPQQQQALMDAMSALEDKAVDLIVATTERNIDNELGYFLLTNYTDLETFGADRMLQLLDRLPAPMAQRSDAQRLRQSIDELKQVQEGSTIADPAVSTPDGQPLSLKAEAALHRLTLIDFWASWCGPCRAEAPFMVQLYQQYASQGLGIVGLSLDDDRDAWLSAISELGFKWPQASDLDGWNSQAASMYRVTSIPHIIVVDQQGTILARGLRGEELRQFVSEHLQ